MMLDLPTETTLAPRYVHVVDDDRDVRRGLSFMLGAGEFQSRPFASGQDFLDSLPELQPGCILLDIRMPDQDGFQVMEALTARGVEWPVIVMTGHGEVSVAVRAMKAGAIDFIEKPFEKASLVAALEEGFARIEQSGRRHARAEEAKARLKGLTARELEVLEGLVRGHPNKTIAYDLGISPRTVEIHRANVMQKLDVPSLSDALRIAFAAGLGDDPDEGAPAA